jgi:hypothetical protein
VGVPLTAVLARLLRYDEEVKLLTSHPQISRTKGLSRNFYTKVKHNCNSTNSRRLRLKIYAEGNMALSAV